MQNQRRGHGSCCDEAQEASCEEYQVGKKEQEVSDASEGLSGVEQFLIEVPFTPRDYYMASIPERIKMIKQFAEMVGSKAPDFSWEEVRKRFEESPGSVVSCSCEAQTWKLALMYEKKVAVLEERMEDICKEMEHVRKEAKRKAGTP